MNKPSVEIFNWKVVDDDGIQRLEGFAVKHQRLGSQQIYTSRILKADFEKKRVETKNTIYILK